MKWSFSINQRAIIENNLTIDIVEAAVFDLIKDFSHSEKCRKTIENGKVYFWISWKLIDEQAPILGLKTRQSVYNRIGSLVENGLLERHPQNQILSQSWFCFGVNYNKLISYTPVNISLQGVNETLQPCKDLVTPPVNISLHNTTISNKEINNTVIQQNEILHTPQEIITEKKEKKQKSTATAFVPPTESEFFKIAKEQSVKMGYNWNLDFERHFKIKFANWSESQWRDGRNKPIQNLRSTINSQLPYVKTNPMTQQQAQASTQRKYKTIPQDVRDRIAAKYSETD